MNTLIHICKKDFAFAKPWILGTWLAFAIGNILPWISPEGEDFMPFMLIRLLAPAVMVFLTSTKIVHCDPFVGTSGFIGTRPVRATTLLRNKLILIALVLVLPAVVFALVHAACMRVQLSASDYLLLFIENCLYFALIAGVAMAFSVITRGVGVMAIFIVGTLIMLVPFVAFYAPPKPFGVSLEDQHLLASIWLVAQAFLPIAAVAIAMSWAAGRRIWMTAAVSLLSVGILIPLVKQWNWNFVDAMSKDATAAEIVSDRAEVKWTDAPSFGSNNSRNNITYSQVTRPGRVTGLKDGWTGKLVKFQSQARFADGAVWTSEGISDLYLFGDLAPAILPQLGIQVSEDHPMRLYEKSWSWPLFECEKSRLQEMPGRIASIHGVGTFQLYQPVVLVELPAQAGASAVSGRFRCRIDSLNAFEGQISVELGIRSVALSSKGDGSKALLPVELLLVNTSTKEFTNTSGSGGSSITGGELMTFHKTVSIYSQSASAGRPDAVEFLKGARLYILGTRYGGNIVLPYEIPEMMLEEKR